LENGQIPLVRNVAVALARKVVARVVLAEPPRGAGALAASADALLRGRQVRPRSHGLAARAELLTRRGHGATLEAVAPMCVILVCYAAGSGNRRRNGRKTRSRKRHNLVPVDGAKALVEVGMGCHVQVGSAAVAAVVALLCAEAAGAAAGYGVHL
jgi:hypothetical protein